LFWTLGSAGLEASMKKSPDDARSRMN
jgi:hypothetical protein